LSWMVFSYSLPSKSSSSPRVTLWRRLRRLGAISLKGGIQVLPDREECIEAFQWLSQEVQQAKGEALVMQVEQFSGLTDQDMIELFRQARSEDYQEIGIKAIELEAAVNAASDSEERSSLLDTLAKLQKQHSDVARVDFFDCADGPRVMTQLNRIAQTFAPRQAVTTEISHAAIAAYQNKRWVTRPRPFIDRLACAWFIRRFINPDAVIRYSAHPEPDEVGFDLKDCEFGHQGNLCSFETMMAKFDLDQPGLRTIAEIVHELDLRDSLYVHPETTGIETVMRGWLLEGLSDAELEAWGIRLFDGLYTALSNGRSSSIQSQ
jgi:hypothetical protein